MKPQEGRFIDYKQRLPKNLDDILPDISAFANTHGGTIVFGISEDAGVPIECVGLDVDDIDKEKLRLASVIENNLDPALRGCRQDWITSSAGKRVLVLRIPQSGSAPHRITKGSPKFYSRGEAGNSPMDTIGLRNAFESQGMAARRFSEFSAGRVAAIFERSSAFPMRKAPYAVFHLMPVKALSRPDELPIPELRRKIDTLGTTHMALGIPRVCLDGVGVVTGEEMNFNTSVLFFRSGALEIILPCEFVAHNGSGVNPLIFQTLADDVETYVVFLEQFGVTGPWLASLKFLNCSGLRMTANPSSVDQNLRAIPADYFPLPMLDYIDETMTWSNVSQFFADRLANQFGLPLSPFFKDGKFELKKYW